jgi:uncharacterized protein YqjF (DUF2071 family)
VMRHQTSVIGPERLPPETAPHRVVLPTNVQQWENIAFLHWRIDPEEIQRRLPSGLTVDLHDGAAWISVTPFFIRVRPLGLPAVPPFSAFPETNVRTYVVGPDGGQGLWFLRMEVTALWFVVALRTLGLPYLRRQMSVDVAGAAVDYRSSPNSSSEADRHDIVVRYGVPLAPRSGGPTAQFLTARWHAYHRVGTHLLRTPVEHPAWELSTADVEQCDVKGLFAAIGLPAPVGDPLVQISRGVRVKVGAPKLVA